MNSTAVIRTPSVAPLNAFGADDLLTVGGKAANLGELLRAGLPVPEGFVVTTEAYAEAAESVGLPELIAAVEKSMVEGGPQESSPEEGASEEADPEAGSPGTSVGAGTEGRLGPADLRAAMVGAAVPEELRAHIVSAYERLGEDVPVAVRSSAPRRTCPERPSPDSRTPISTWSAPRPWWTRSAAAGPRCGPTGRWPTAGSGRWTSRRFASPSSYR